MNANVAIAALAGGNVDYTMIFGSVVRAAIRGLPMKVVASFIDGSTHALIARGEFKSIKELKGKTLGVQAYGATDHVAAAMMLKKFGVDPEKEIKVVALGPAAGRLAALKEGVVEVAVISPPADEEAKRLGFKILARAYEVFAFPFVGLGTQVKKLQDKPDEVKKNDQGTNQSEPVYSPEPGRCHPDFGGLGQDNAGSRNGSLRFGVESL